MLIYLLSFLDRSNIVRRCTTHLSDVADTSDKGNARLLNSDTGDSLVQSTHLTNHQYLIALMIFIVAYTLSEVPSNYMLKKFRPSRW